MIPPAATSPDPSWQQTYTGGVFRAQAPTVDMLCLDDMAHALALGNRFTGHTMDPYSVGEHLTRASIWVERELTRTPAMRQTYGRQEVVLITLATHVHDGGEAYITDVARPVKELPEMEGYRLLEHRVDRVVEEFFWLPEGAIKHPWVKRADLVMLATEARDLMAPAPQPWLLPEPPMRAKIRPWSWRKTERLWKARARMLYAELRRLIGAAPRASLVMPTA